MIHLEFPDKNKYLLPWRKLLTIQLKILEFTDS